MMAARTRTVEEAERAGARVIPARCRLRGVGGAFRSAVAYGLDQGADSADCVSLDADGQFDAADDSNASHRAGRGGPEADFATASRFRTLR